MVKHKATCTVDILFIPTSLVFLPYNVTAHNLVIILFLCYVLALITVLVLVYRRPLIILLTINKLLHEG